MEKQPEHDTRVQVTKAVFDGLEYIRNSGATNMLDRATVLILARGWDFTETADWIESVDTGTYGRVVFQGPDVIENDLTDQVVENDAINQANKIDMLNKVMDDEKANMRDIIAILGKQASLTIADTYETELMGVLIDPSRQQQINAERYALIRNVAEASNQWAQLEETMNEIQRGVGSLQYLIDPENN